MVHHPHLYPHTHRMQRTEPIYKTPARRTEGEGEGEAKCECEDDDKGDGDDEGVRW